MTTDEAVPAAPVPVVFRLHAEATPGLLPRLLAPFARRDLIPDRVIARRDGSAMLVEIGLHAMPAEVLHLVAGNLGQVVGVRTLACEETVPAIAAA